MLYENLITKGLDSVKFGFTFENLKLQNLNFTQIKNVLLKINCRFFKQNNLKCNFGTIILKSCLF